MAYSEEDHGKNPRWRKWLVIGAVSVCMIGIAGVTIWLSAGS